MKVVFLDIDGVLNSASSSGPYVSDMDINKLRLLSSTLKAADAGIVITSDRRLSDADMKEKKEAFLSFGIKVLGMTRDPYEEDDDRGKQILDFLSEHPEIESMAILDDNDEGISPLFCEDFININRYFGFDEKAASRLLNLLR